MGTGGKSRFNTVSIPSRLLLHPLHLQLPGISKKKTLHGNQTNSFRLKIGEGVKSIDVLLKWSIPLFCLGETPTILASPSLSLKHPSCRALKHAPCELRPPHMAWPYKDLPHRRANDTKETWFFSHCPGCPGSHQHVFLFVCIDVLPKKSPITRISIFTSRSRIDPTSAGTPHCNCPKAGYLFKLPHGREASGK